VDDEASDVFAACKDVANIHLSTARALLPHLVLHVIRVGEAECRAFVGRELLLVLQAATELGGHSATAPSAQHCSGDTPNDEGTLEAIAGPGDGLLRSGVHRLAARAHQGTRVSRCAGGAAVDSLLLQLATQTCFELLDHLTEWAEGTCGRPYDPQKSPQLRVVFQLLDEVEPRLLAVAAFRCKAFARALRYMEVHLRTDARQRANHKSTSLLGVAALGPLRCGSAHFVSERSPRQVLAERDVTLLQRILVGLREQDALRGVTSLSPCQVGQQRSTHAALDLEHLGHWDSALSAYDVVVQTTLHSAGGGDPRSARRVSHTSVTARNARLGINRALHGLGLMGRCEGCGLRDVRRPVSSCVFRLIHVFFFFSLFFVSRFTPGPLSLSDSRTLLFCV
jgi:hypothetical protein